MLGSLHDAHVVFCFVSPPCWTEANQYALKFWSGFIYSVPILLSSPCPVFSFPVCLSVFLESREGVSQWMENTALKRKDSGLLVIFYFSFIRAPSHFTTLTTGVYLVLQASAESHEIVWCVDLSQYDTMCRIITPSSLHFRCTTFVISGFIFLHIFLPSLLISFLLSVPRSKFTNCSFASSKFHKISLPLLPPSVLLREEVAQLQEEVHLLRQMKDMLSKDLEETQGGCSANLLSATELRVQLSDKEQELDRAKEALQGQESTQSPHAAPSFQQLP